MKITRKLQIATLSVLACALLGPQAALAKGNHFAKMDTNQNGLISLAEMQNAVNQRFVQQDTNQDGKISLAEIQQAHQQRMAKFQQKAQNANKQRKARDPQKMAQRMQKHFAKRDLNNDGFISKDEILKGLQTRFAKLDTNKDGQLSKDEMKAGHKHRKAHRNNPLS